MNFANCPIREQTNFCNLRRYPYSNKPPLYYIEIDNFDAFASKTEYKAVITEVRTLDWLFSIDLVLQDRNPVVTEKHWILRWPQTRWIRSDFKQVVGILRSWCTSWCTINLLVTICHYWMMVLILRWHVETHPCRSLPPSLRCYAFEILMHYHDDRTKCRRATVLVVPNQYYRTAVLFR